MSKTNKYRISKREAHKLVLPCGTILRRIVALKEFKLQPYATCITIKPGDIGGYVETKHNLDQKGNCWIANNAKVYGKAFVAEDAVVLDSTEVFGKAVIAQQAVIRSTVKVYDTAIIRGKTQLTGPKTEVYGNARITMLKLNQLYNIKVFGQGRITDGAMPEFSDHKKILEISKTPTVISTFPYEVIITDKHTTIGCQTEKHSYWLKAKSKDVSDNPRIQKLWKQHGDSVKHFIKHHKKLVKAQW